MIKNYVIGLDYGSDSVRAVLIDSANGDEIAASVHWYERWKNNAFCDPSINQFRQHPLDHIEGLEITISELVKKSGVLATSVKGICIDTTGSSPVPLNKQGVPLALTEPFQANPNAMMILWKDHTALKEAEEINALAQTWGGENFTKYEGGIYSSEWFWAKILHCIRQDNAIKEQAYTWMEHCDLMTFLLIEQKELSSFKRSRCAAGHKAMWHASWNGLPDEEFLSQLDPYLAQLRKQLYTDTYTSNEIAGTLSEAWAKKLGLTTDTVVSVGTFDAHAGAVGAKIEGGALVRVMGTSTCDIMIAAKSEIGHRPVRGICGQVDGSVIPDYIGLEAGQSAFGDVLAWFYDLLQWPIEHVLHKSSVLSEIQKKDLQQEIETELLSLLTKQASEIPLNESLPIALDWINGRRTPDANQSLKSAITNLSLGTTAPHIFKALINSICFGSKKIVDRFEAEGIAIDQVIGIGGVAKKSPFIMQTLANVLNRPVKVVSSDQAPALGAAIYASVAAGIHPDVLTASHYMGSSLAAVYSPETSTVAHYATLMEKYEELGLFVENLTKTESHVEI